jgi:transketolase N-terminal domain/subunit
MISDGECAEGSIWEALRFAYEKKIHNLKIYVNANGWAAYDPVDLDYLEDRIKAFNPYVNFVRTSVECFGLSGLDAHYTNFTEDQYLEAVKSL